MRFGRTFFIIILLFSILETVRLWFIVPTEMASHFNMAGNPDNFVHKLQFFGFQVQTLIVVVGLALVAQILLVILPMQLINLPNREYWLSSEQRPGTVERLSSFLFSLFGSVLLVIHFGFELSVSANLHEPKVFAAQLMLPAIAGFIIYSFFLLFQLTRSFRISPSIERKL